MKRSAICILPAEKTASRKYKGYGNLELADTAVHYPINAMLEKTLKPEDKIDIFLLVQDDQSGQARRNEKEFREEFAKINRKIKADVAFHVIEYPDGILEVETRKKLSDELSDPFVFNDNFAIDITYGPKDLWQVVFTALIVAEKYLNSKVETVIYAEAALNVDKSEEIVIGNMMSLYTRYVEIEKNYKL